MQVHFRKWANQIVKDYTIQGWAMDVDRLKKVKAILTALQRLVEEEEGGS